MIHEPETWTDRTGRDHRSCAGCEEPWPCPAAGRPAGWLLPDYGGARETLAAIAHGFDVPVETILSPNRERRVMLARHCAMAAVYRASGLSHIAVGKVFQRDHTTVMQAIRKVESDPALHGLVDRFLSEVSSAGEPVDRPAVRPAETA